MSFLPVSEENQQTPTGSTTPNPTGSAPPTGSGSAGTGQGGAGAAGASTGTPSQFGSSASKLGDYLTANAPQIQGQAQGVANSLNNQYGQVGADISNAAGQFGQQVQTGYTPGNSSLVDQAAANPTGFVNTPSNIAGFQAQYNDTYTGPQSYETSNPYANTQSEVNTAISNAGLLNTAPGLQSYFAQQNPGQTQASNSLDQLLVQNDPNANKTIANAISQFGNLTPQLQQSVVAQDQGIANAQQAAQQAQAYAQNAINGPTGTLTNLNNQVNSETQTALANAEDQNALANQGIAAGINMTPQEQAALGLTQTQWGPLQQALTDASTSQYMTAPNFGAASATQNIPLQQYLQQLDPNSVINTADVGTAQQYAETAALQQLLGGTLPQGTVLNPGQASLAGTAPTNLNKFNSDAALQNAANIAAQERADAQAQANQLSGQALAAHNASKSHTLGGDFMNNIGSPLAKFLANPIAAIPNEVTATQTGLNKLGKKI